MIDERGFLIGIEREGLRTDEKGRLALTPHPPEFGDRLENFRISTDFGEAMLEFRTAPLPDPGTCYEELLRVTREVLRILAERGEYLWPYSMPCRMPEEGRFRFNSYPGHPDMEEYERELAAVYGIRRLCISGIHFNFSLNDAMYAFLRSRYPSVPEDRDEAYMRCCRRLLKCERLVRHFLDASPSDLAGSLTRENSFRNSPGGYRNEKARSMDFSSKSAYVTSVSRLKPYERFGPVRVKSGEDTNRDAGIIRSGIRRIELRLCDIDPFDICGVSLTDLDFMTAVFFFCMSDGPLPETPGDLLVACRDVDRDLSLDLDRGISELLRQEAGGRMRSDRVRALIGRYGMDGFLRLARDYAGEALLSPDATLRVHALDRSVTIETGEYL